MSLTTFLYRCPECGHDPLVERRGRARCGGCGAEIRRGRGGAILVNGRPRTAAELARSLDGLGGALPSATEDDDGRAVRYRTHVVASRCVGMDPIRSRGELLGYAERWGREVEGTLEATEASLRFVPESDSSEALELDPGDLKAVQTSSSALQLDGPEGLVQFRFVDDSVRRWEALVRTLVRRVWEASGKGQVTEFQPRIVGER